MGHGRDLFDPHRGQPLGVRLRRLSQTGRQPGVVHHVTEGRATALLGTEPGAAQVASVGDQHFVNGGRVLPDALPQPLVLKQLHRARRKRR